MFYEFYQRTRKISHESENEMARLLSDGLISFQLPQPN